MTHYINIKLALDKELGRRGLGKWQNKVPPEAILAMLEVIERSVMKTTPFTLQETKDG